MNNEDLLRRQLGNALAWGDAHATFEQAVADIPVELRGKRATGLPHSVWELVEHLRITQSDILAFCRTTPYVHLQWPEDYWPAQPAPESGEKWEASLAAYLSERQEIIHLASADTIDLLRVVPNGTDQTYLRELLLIIDHTAYHIGQIILVRRALGIWPG